MADIASTMENAMTLDQLKQKLKTDRVERIKYIAATLEYYEKLGVDINDALLKKFDEDAIKAVTSGMGGGSASTNIIAIF